MGKIYNFESGKILECNDESEDNKKNLELKLAFSPILTLKCCNDVQKTKKIVQVVVKKKKNNIDGELSKKLDLLAKAKQKDIQKPIIGCLQSAFLSDLQIGGIKKIDIIKVYHVLIICNGVPRNSEKYFTTLQNAQDYIETIRKQGRRFKIEEIPALCFVCDKNFIIIDNFCARSLENGVWFSSCYKFLEIKFSLGTFFKEFKNARFDFIYKFCTNTDSLVSIMADEKYLCTYELSSSWWGAEYPLELDFPWEDGKDLSIVRELHRLLNEKLLNKVKTR